MSPTPAICFDNSGTLCETVVRETAHTDDDVWRRPVPDVPLEAGRAALLSLDHGGVDCLDRDGSLGAALRDADVPLHLALSNTDIDTEQAAAVVRGASEIPARAALTDLRGACDAALDVREDGGAVTESAVAGPLDTDLPVGIQFVVDVDAGRVVRTIGYCCQPLPVAVEVVGWATDRPLDPHLVSGDTAPILARVADTVGIDDDAVHAYQSPADKRETVESLQAAGRQVVMVGDYVNDREAFAAADLAVFIDHGRDSVREVLAPVADVVVDDLAALPAALDEQGL